MESVVAALSAVTAVVVLITAVVTYHTRLDVKEVHILVNSKMTDALDRIEQLTIALVEADTDVPAEPDERPMRTPPVIP